MAHVLSRIGGIEMLMDYARLSRDGRVRSLADEWRDRSASGKPQEPHPRLETLCKMHGIMPLNLLREVAIAALEFNTSVATLITAQALPHVVKACVKRAVRADGVEDRKMLFRHSGFLP